MNRWRKSRLVSFRNALEGIWFNLRNEPNFLIQLAIAAVVVSAAAILRLSRSDWMILVAIISVVLAAEVLNTAIEKICDRFLDREDSRVKIIKDSAAGAVLIIAIAAAIIGILVFLPYVLEWINGSKGTL